MTRLSAHFPKAEKISFKNGEVICQTHSRVESLLILIDGEIEYYLADEFSDDRTTLIGTSEPDTIIGWEILIPAQRFISYIQIKSTKATFYRINPNEFIETLTTDLLTIICQKVYRLLEISFHRQANLLGKTVKQRAVKLDNYFISQDSTLEERFRLLSSSPFFGEFKEHEIKKLAEIMERREYDANELIYDQDQDAKGIFVLIQGEVSIRRQEGDSYLNLRSISTPGYIFGWSSIFKSVDICRASTEFKTSVYFLPLSGVEKLMAHSAFGIDLLKMVIWLLANQLQMSHSRYLALLDNHHQIAIKQLIDVNASRIPLASPLQIIPHLLEHTSTHHLAFSSLHELQRNGNRQEKHLASICLDLLVKEERELAFMNSISEVYEAVSRGGNNQPSENRKTCAEKTREVFAHTSLHIEGEENLPESSGNIFIYNHLVNHPRYTLNNHFQLTLDSHFISSMILDPKYDDPGMRTVRYGKSHEYGHQEYYENLGYLNVYTSDSDLQDVEAKEAAKVRFYDEAEKYLNQGINMIISPEGTSFRSEESPGPFKMGPFNLARRMKKEPKFVPIVFYNFDKRITENHFYCRILKPFKLSEKMNSNLTLKEFVNAYTIEFEEEVTKAREEADGLFQKLNN